MTTHRRDDVSRLLPRPLRAVVVAALLASVLAPVLYLLFASVNSDLSVAEGAFLPTTLDFGNYLRIWSTTDLGNGLG